MRRFICFAKMTATAVLLGALAIAPPALGADRSDDGVLTPGALERQRPLRRLVGRRLASDAPLAPGTVKRPRRPVTPCPPEVLPPGAATSGR
jgi:hypothetical protein